MRTYLTVAAVVCFGSALVLAWRRLSVFVRGVKAIGRVVAHERREDDSTEYFLPVVAFTDLDGRSHRFTSVAGGPGRRPTVGSEVSVRYLPESPSTAFISSFLHMWAAPLAFAALGAGAVLVAIRW